MRLCGRILDCHAEDLGSNSISYKFFSDTFVICCDSSYGPPALAASYNCIAKISCCWGLETVFTVIYIATQTQSLSSELRPGAHNCWIPMGRARWHQKNKSLHPWDLSPRLTPTLHLEVRGWGDEASPFVRGANTWLVMIISTSGQSFENFLLFHFFILFRAMAVTDTGGGAQLSHYHCRCDLITAFVINRNITAKSNWRHLLQQAEYSRDLPALANE